MGTSSLDCVKINQDGIYEKIHSNSWDIRGTHGHWVGDTRYIFILLIYHFPKRYSLYGM